MTPAADAPRGGAAERLVVGLVRGLHGLHGAVRVEILTDDLERFAPDSILHPEGSDRPLTVLEKRDDKPPGLLVRFRELPDRTAAESLRDTYLEADAPAEPLAPETYYWHEIVGTRVTTTDGRLLGRVEDVFRAGEAEIYVVRGDGREHLVPAVSSVVRELAPREGRIVVDEVALGLTGEEPEEEEAEGPA